MGNKNSLKLVHQKLSITFMRRTQLFSHGGGDLSFHLFDAPLSAAAKFELYIMAASDPVIVRHTFDLNRS